MSVRQVWKRKTSTPKSSPSSQKDSPPLPPRVHFQSPSPPSYNPLRDQMINQLHNISTILDSHTNPSNAYIHVPPSPPPQPIHPPSHAQVEFHSNLVSSDLSYSSHLSSQSSAREEHSYSPRNELLFSDLSSLLLNIKSLWKISSRNTRGVESRAKRTWCIWIGLSDLFPVLRGLDIQGLRRDYTKNLNQIYSFTEKLIDERRERNLTGTGKLCWKRDQ
ncbi:hypothetical protein Tco_0903494, partial [Tanacetum coccineum]